MISLSNLGINNRTNDPSCMQVCCFCQWRSVERKLSGLEEARQLRGLTGVMLQDMEGFNSGKLLTFKWGTRDGRMNNLGLADFDIRSRSFTTPVYANFDQPAGVGLRSEEVSCRSCCCMNLQRLAGCTYRIRFRQEFEAAQVETLFNPCICIPCLPRCCSIPRSCFSLDMVQHGNYLGFFDGTHWELRASSCGGGPYKAGELLTVFHSDGSKGPYYDRFLERCPQQVMVAY
eukprot:TRINITY_DN43919_c0_g1_i1.p1 TRINITY_DN43919_c0_g1~~TRINITY_DN43919_c0_g1_i1.p1  ORF type:complete len:231 (-),score=12.22 TRINITY_DN43919_c0_g1_i1:67-759(-)